MRRLNEPIKIEDGPDSDVLIVEGDDDFFALKNSFIREKLTGKVKLESAGGYSKLIASIDTRIDESNLQHLGVIVDADEVVAARWDSIRNSFEACGYAMPQSPDALGTIVSSDGRPTIGVWIMPDNQLPGELEDFVSLLIPTGDVLWPIATKAVDDIPEQARAFEPSVTKARIHTWLAWQEEPGKPIGQAIVKRYLSTETEAAQAFLGWLKRLFNLSS